MRSRKKLVVASAAIAVVVVVLAMPMLMGIIKERWWISQLEHGSDREKLAAIESLGSIRSRRAVPILIRQFENGYDDGPFLQSILALAAIGPDCVPDLIAALRSENQHTRLGAVIVLGSMRTASARALPELIRLAREDIHNVRKAAILAVRDIDLANERVIEMLIEVTDTEENSQLRKTAVLFLKELGPLALEAIPALRRAKQSGNSEISTAAAEALRAIEPGRTSP